jgi:hypothetical protein
MKLVIKTEYEVIPITCKELVTSLNSPDCTLPLEFVEPRYLDDVQKVYTNISWICHQRGSKKLYLLKKISDKAEVRK